MGIYRLLDVLVRDDPTNDGNKIPGGHKRIVICYPPHNYNMDPSDMVCRTYDKCLLGIFRRISI